MVTVRCGRNGCVIVSDVFGSQETRAVRYNYVVMTREAFSCECGGRDDNRTAGT